MRLTLRTLLAFMDEILEPADREELAKKVEASDFANDLIHRTKDTMRRLRLSAPHVVGTGIGLDPNTVAEYLDNALPPESVADFERICLESDVHLAEVASCHHVLTMVLGEPAEVEPAARQRMYSIPAEAERRKQVRIEPAHTIPALGRMLATTPPPVAKVYPATSGSPVASAPPRVRRASTDIPDYLRASAWHRYRILLAGLAAVLLLAMTAFLVFGLRGWIGAQRELAANTAGQAPTGIQPLAVATPESGSIRSSASVEPSGITRSDAEPAGDLTLPPEKSNAASAEQAPPALLMPGIGDSTTASTDDGHIAAIESAASSVSEPTNLADTATQPVLASSVPGVDASPEFDVTAGEEVGTGVASGEHTDTTSVVGSSETAASAATHPAGDAAAELGTYLDGKNVLLRYDPSASAWFRMMPRGTVREGDKLLAVPAFYPKITLATGIHLKLAGGTLVSFAIAPPGAASGAAGRIREVPVIDVTYGKVVLVNTASGDNDVQLKLGATGSTIRLLQNATIALEVIPNYIPGRDPRQSPSPVVIHAYVREGGVVWNDSNGARSIASPGQWSVTDNVASTVSTDAEFPKWIDEEPIDPPTDQRFAAPAIERALEPTRSVEEQLLELYQTSHQREVKSLVARSSVYVGQFVPFIEALRDSEQKGTWKTQIETLRSAMALGPESADQIWQTLVEQRGDAAAHDLYEMLCGYDQDQIGHTAQQVAAGPVARLIDRLENDSLDYRVLAVQDLWEITGKQLMRNPAGTPSERAKGVRLWRERLKSGELVSTAR